ncbi:MAG: ribosome-associated translation inhibitor RaiA [Patescibacteria group bacterium]
MTITIHGTNIELTDALKQYAEEKIEGLTKFFDNIQSARIDIGKRSNHHHKGEIFYAEVNLSVPGHMLRVVKEEADLYKAIDKVKDHFKVELESMKEKMRRKDKKGLRRAKEYKEE